MNLTDYIQKAIEHRGDMTPEQKLSAIRDLVNEQAEDEALWFIEMPGEAAVRTIHEAYLQQELRKLHALIEEMTERNGD